MIHIRISDLRSLASWYIKWTDESFPSVDSSVPLMRYSGGSRPLDGRGSDHPDPEIPVSGGGGRSPKKFFRPFGPHFGRKIRGEPGPPGPSPGFVTALWSDWSRITDPDLDHPNETHPLYNKKTFNIIIPFLCCGQSKLMCVFSNAGQMDASFGHQVAWNNHTHQYVPESDNQFFSLHLIQTFPLF